MQTDNTKALGVVKNNVMKRVESVGIKFHWLRCQKIKAISVIYGRQSPKIRRIA